MTEDRDFKKLVRDRAAKTGESYQAARRQVLAQRGAVAPPFVDAVAAYFDAYEIYVEEWSRSGEPWREFDAVVPVAAMQEAALRHPNAKVRRACLGVLDHAANDNSQDVFRKALTDPVPRVRLIAMHGLSCERCRVGQLDVPGVVSDILVVAGSDDSPKVRVSAIALLAALAGRDDRAATALADISTSDPHPLVRQAAIDALAGAHFRQLTWTSLRRRAALRKPDPPRD